MAVRNLRGASWVRRLALASASAAVAVGLMGTVMRVRGDDDGTAADAAASEPAPFKPITEKIAPEDLSDAQVMQAIHGGEDYLLKRLDAYDADIEKAPDTMRGRPGVLGNGDVGQFMLTMYTLLYLGQDTGDKRLHFRTDRMKIGLDTVLRWDGETDGSYQYETYVTGLQALALAQLPATDEVRKAMQRVATRLAAGITKEGGFGYHLEGKGENQWDHSNSQYGLLGEWAAADWGAVVPGDFWKVTDDFWRTSQNADGGWGYSPGNRKESTFSMTAAGVASLYVCSEYLDHAVKLEPFADAAKERGLANLEAAFDPASRDYYAMYGVERVGLAAGLKYLGDKNWYRAAAVNLLTHQREDGGFGGSTSVAGNDDIVSTCYCLLFLARGRAPVVMNKLEYPGVWNARPRDSANMHAYLQKAFERHMNWQVESIDAPVEDWLDAPILYITGYKAPEFSDEDVGKLRDFVHAGGIVFSVSEGGSKAFDAAMEKYAMEVAAVDDAAGAAATQAAGGAKAPAKQAASAPANAVGKWRQLPADHPLYTIYGKAKTPIPLFGVSNGVRELWVHCPQDLGAVWQAREMVKNANGTTDVPAKDREAWDTPARLFFYAAGIEGLRSKLQPLGVKVPETMPGRKIGVVEAKWEGNWNPEPGAWPRLGKLMARDGHADVEVSEADPVDIAQMDAKPSLVHLAGTGRLTMTKAQEDALKKYVLGGGTLFVEAVGGDMTFAQSGALEVQRMFPEGKLAVIPASYLIYNGTFTPDAQKVDGVEYRKYWILQHGRRTTPELMYVTVNKRIAVIYSADDVTSGLLGTNTWPVGGYTTESAVKLAWDVVLFAGVNDAQPKPATQPAQ